MYVNVSSNNRHGLVNEPFIIIKIKFFSPENFYNYNGTLLPIHTFVYNLFLFDKNFTFFFVVRSFCFLQKLL